MSSVPCCDLSKKCNRCKGTHYFLFHQILGENLTQFNYLSRLVASMSILNIQDSEISLFINLQKNILPFE